jgi:hypothetical protein
LKVEKATPSVRNVLLIHDEIVEDPHHRPFGGDRRLLVDRHARGAVPKIDLENAALPLCKRRPGDQHRNQKWAAVILPATLAVTPASAHRDACIMI